MARIKKYADPKEKYLVYKKKNPQVRLSINEKKLLYKLRENPELLELLIDNMDTLQKVVSTSKGGVHSITKVVSTNPISQNSSQIDSSLSNENLVRELRKVGTDVKFGTSRRQLHRFVNKHNNQL